jgi:hypothetical protein
VTAIVLTSKIHRRDLAASMIANFYERIGIAVKIFADCAAALEWVVTELTVEI